MNKLYTYINQKGEEDTIPPLLVSLSGKKVETKEEWEEFRRREVKGLLCEYEYGFTPVGRPDDISFEVTEIIPHNEYELNEKKIDIKFGGYTLPVRLFLPQNKQGKIPCFIFFYIESQEKNYSIDETLEQPILPIPEITKRGFAVCVMPTSKVYPDWMNESDYRDGVYSVYAKDRDARQSHDWGGVAAWAWGGSRVMDYLEADEDIDEKKVITLGHSRGGKASLWCGANDERIALVISNSSGCGGAAMYRGKHPDAEHIKNIICSDWFCENYSDYAFKDEYIPVDQHMLLSMVAPRNLYVQSCALDIWADPDGELLSCKLASEVYELYGKNGVIIEDEIKHDVGYHEGSIAYHRTPTDHLIRPEDWKLYMDYAEKIFK